MLSDVERTLHELIRSKEDMGILWGDMRRETGLQDNVIKKSLKSLKTKNLIKVLPNIQKKGLKHFVAVEFETSKEITGGSCYTEGKLGIELIKIMKDQNLKHIDRMKVATIEGILESLCRSGAFKIECSSQQIAEIVQALILDSEVEEIKSTGDGNFAFVAIGKVCYRRLNRRHTVTDVLSSIPCGVCSRVSECIPDGIISPSNCVYFKK